MSFFIYIKDRILPSALILVSAFGLYSCKDDILNPGEGNEYNPADDPNMVCLPFSMSYSVSTRDSSYEFPEEGEDEEEDEDKFDPSVNDGFTFGYIDEHKIDFDTDKECFILLFDENKKIKSIKRLYSDKQLGNGTHNLPTESTTEFTVEAIAYVDRKDVDRSYQLEGEKHPILKYALVVLNGGKIYDTFEKERLRLQASHPEPNSEDDRTKQFDDITSFFELTWDSELNYAMNSSNGSIFYVGDGNAKIGMNSKGYLTMTNSAYHEIVEDNNGQKNKVNKSFIELYKENDDRVIYYSSVNQYLNSESNSPSATAFMERMVAKFINPTFNTEVIGSDLVFRPDQNALPLVVYYWDEANNLYSEQKNWRIHLTGWTINGEERNAFIFKKIPDIDWSEGWDNWNDPVRGRTYWSIDPHYSSATDFYPWQFRKAADTDETISLQTGLTKQKTPVLRYYTYNDIKDANWAYALYFHENTYDPKGPFENNLDDRPSFIAGPHLLITGELYLQDPNGTDYVSGNAAFKKVEHLYSDRIRRFYEDETAWVKMFVRDFNRALITQEKMTFEVYDWDEQNEGKAHQNFLAIPSGQCRLFLRQHKDNFKNFDTSVETIPGVPITDPHDNNKIYHDENYVFTPVTYTLIDNLAKEEGVSLTAVANVRMGDGRLIPWVEKEKVNWQDFGLVVRAPDGSRLKYKPNDNDDKVEAVDIDWGYDMYKSLFYEWFGPVDHYYKGYMYYAGDIRHNEDGTTKYYGTVRNHKYGFFVESINSLGTPIDDPNQLIIPGKYGYNDQIMVYLTIEPWHQRETTVDVNPKVN